MDISFWFFSFFFFLFLPSFLFSVWSLIGSSEFCNLFLLPSVSRKILFIWKHGTFFLSSLLANCLALFRQVSRINKLTFRKITKVQVGCLRDESLNVRWSIRLQKVSIKVTVQAAFACPGKVCFYCQHRVGSCVHPGQEGLVPRGRVLQCQSCCCCCGPHSSKQLHQFQCDKFNCDSIKYGKGARSPFYLTQDGMKEPALDVPSQRLHPMLLTTLAWGKAGSGPQLSPLLPHILLASTYCYFLR